MVITLYPGQAAEEIEKQVTIPVERALTGTPARADPAIDHVVRAVAGHPDLRGRRRHLLGAAAGRRAAARRRGARGHRRRTSGPNDTPVGQVYQYTLESDHHSPSELRSWQDWVVSKHLMRAPGVADVVSFGGFQKEYHVLADPARLRNDGHHAEGPDRRGRGVERRDVGRLPAATASRELVVRGRGYLKSPADIEQHGRQARPNGTPVLVRNVAQVVEAYTPRRGAVARGERDRLGRGDRAAAPRREPEGRAGRRARGGRAHQPRDPAAGHAHRAVLRPHAAGRHDAEHGVAQHDRGHRRSSASSSGCSCAR